LPLLEAAVAQTKAKSAVQSLLMAFPVFFWWFLWECNAAGPVLSSPT